MLLRLLCRTQFRDPNLPQETKKCFKTILFGLAAASRRFHYIITRRLKSGDGPDRLEDLACSFDRFLNTEWNLPLLSSIVDMCILIMFSTTKTLL